MNVIDKHLNTLAATAVPSTAVSIREKLGYSAEMVKRVLVAAHQLGLVHIHSWDRSRSRYLPVYAIGSGTDAGKPHKTNAQRQKEYRMRKAGIQLLHNSSSQGVGNVDIREGDTVLG